MTARRSPPVNLTLPPLVLAALARLAAEDAAATGRDPGRQRSATVADLILAEEKRRARRQPGRHQALLEAAQSRERGRRP